ncbi:MAG: D-aminoacylase [Gammaproteobacteria bacterium]|nr:D-aminoacylase [Gammaproteobacteria bacterium]
MPKMDYVLRNATIVDGTGALPFQGDVGITGGRIEQLGQVTGQPITEMDLKGLALSPGFIDVHTHDDFAAILYPDMAFKLLGGVTTCVVGNCGMGAAPFPQAATLARAFHPNQTLPGWEGYKGYLAYLDAHPTSLNIAALVGHGTVRMAVMGRKDRAPSPEELATMKALVQEGLDAGAVGFSSGLVYEPGCYAQTEELISLAALMKNGGGLYTTHMRNEGNQLLEAVDEAIEIGEKAGVPVQISHHKASGQKNWGKVVASIRRIELAQARGLNIHADQYPYTAGSTILSAVLHQGAFEDANENREAIAPENVVIASTQSTPEWEGKSIREMMQILDLPPREAVIKILEKESGATVVMHTISEEDVRLVMKHDSTMIGSDGIPTLDGKPHPRLYNTFARVLGHYSRELRLLPIEEAVYKMTGFSARKFDLVDRGEIRVGAYADLVVFDADTIIDKGTFMAPNQYPAGIHHVFVNGVLAVKEGNSLNTRSGRTLRRQ